MNGFRRRRQAVCEHCGKPITRTVCVDRQCMVDQAVAKYGSAERFIAHVLRGDVDRGMS